MRHLTLFATMILASGATLSAQAPDKSCCDVKLLTSAGSPGEVAITITNKNEAVVRVLSTSPEWDLRPRVTSATGQEASRTEYGDRLLNPPYGIRVTRNVETELKKGDTITERLDIRRIFELSSGTYDVYITRDVFVGGARVQLEATTKVTIP